MKILITAFEPFDNNETNYSLEVLNKIKLREEIKKIILPVEYYESFNELKKIIEEENPLVIILLGEARSYDKVSFEVIGINEVSLKPDNKGFIPRDTKLVLNEVDGLFSSLDFNLFESSFLEVNTKINRSYSAGTYVCNALLYQTLLYLRENKKTTKCGFIHIPDLLKQDLNEIVNGFNNYLNNLIKTLD